MIQSISANIAQLKALDLKPQRGLPSIAEVYAAAEKSLEPTAEGKNLVEALDGFSKAAADFEKRIAKIAEKVRFDEAIASAYWGAAKSLEDAAQRLHALRSYGIADDAPKAKTGF